MTSNKPIWLLTLPILSLLMLIIGCQDKESEVGEMPTHPIPQAFQDGKELSGENAWLHVEHLCKLGPRPNGSKALQESRNYITEYLQKLGWTVNQQSFEQKTPLGQRNFVNLTARFQPDQAPQIPVGIISGHIDTKSYKNIDFIGANDGASHTGLILELARILAQTPEKARLIELVFFDGEEAFGENILPGHDGLFGSLHYAKYYRNLPRDQKPQWAINLDMVGHKELRIEVPSDTPRKLYEIYRDCARHLPQGRQRFGASYGSIVDDHLPLNQVGIPAIDIIQGNFNNSNWWHKEGDTLEIISPASLELSGKLVLKMLNQLITDS